MNVVATAVIVGIFFAVGVVVGIIVVIAMAAIRGGGGDPGPPGPGPCWPDHDDTDDASMPLSRHRCIIGAFPNEDGRGVAGEALGR